MFARIPTFALQGLQPLAVQVEVDIRAGLPAFALVGLGDTAVREARERVHAAILNSGFEFPARRITASLAPAHVRKAGPGFDLSLALGVLLASAQIPPGALEGTAVFGELALDGRLRGCPGALAAAEGAAAAGLTRLLVPLACAREAALVDGLEVIAADRLRTAAEILRGVREPLPLPPPPPQRPAEVPDLADVRGQDAAALALLVAAAGGHNLLLSGPPGTGKTMLARRLPGILPPLNRQEALEVTRIQSVSGLHDGGGLVSTRPFRAPHHTISAPGLIGGGSSLIPGEATLAHHGVLFLDELSEFARPALESLRQPLEDGRVTIVRGQRSAVFPTRCALVAATNPCPCGLREGAGERCRCKPHELDRHRRKLSGPLLDRIDLLVHVRRPPPAELAAPAGLTTEQAAVQVLAARERMTARSGIPNAQLTPRQLRSARFTDDAIAAAAGAYAQRVLSPRGRDRVLRVARTVADLAGSVSVERGHLVTAMGLRNDGMGDGRSMEAAA